MRGQHCKHFTQQNHSCPNIMEGKKKWFYYRNYPHENIHGYIVLFACDWCASKSDLLKTKPKKKQKNEHLMFSSALQTFNAL